MKTTSIKVNYIFNTLLTLSNFLFPLITFPYVARILGPEGIGKVNLAFSVAAYFIMIAQVGIPVYGIKMVSKARDQKEKLNKIFSELFLINSIMTIITIMGYIVLFSYSNKMEQETVLYLIAGSSVFLSLFTIDWFYSGLEEYKFIAMRSIFVKVVTVILLFLFVRETSDYIFYAVITVAGTLITNLMNIFALRNKVSFTFKNISVKRHFKPIIALFSAGLIGSIYANLDVILLGTLAGEKYVGYYSTSRKITGLLVAIIGSLGTVLIPRLSYYLEKGMQTEYQQLAQKSLNFIYFLSFPAIIFVVFMAKDILFFFGGVEFTDASLSLGIIAFQVLATSLAAFFGFQILLPHNAEKGMVVANTAGAMVNIVINFLLIKVIFHNATSLAIVLSETTVAVILMYLSRKHTKLTLINKDVWKYIQASIILAFSLTIASYLMLEVNYIIRLTVAGLISGIVYFGLLIIRKEEFSIMILNKVLRRDI